jgi:hypothetical protein
MPSSVYFDVDIVVIGCERFALPLYTFLKQILGAVYTNYYTFQPAFTNCVLALSNDNKTVTKTNTDYKGVFSFIDVPINKLTKPIYFQFINSSGYFGIGAADSSLAHKEEWDYNEEAENAYIAGWDTWASPASFYKSNSENGITLNDTKPAKMMYTGEGLKVEANNQIIVFPAPPTHKPCIVIFSEKVTITILNEKEYNQVLFDVGENKIVDYVEQ